MISDVDLKGLQPDFIGGSLAHRRKFGGGKSQMIAKAVGIKPKILPTVLDLTAGLGTDAFVLASLGCTVTMLERNSAIFQLLHDGLAQAMDYAIKADFELAAILKRLILIQADSLDYLAQRDKITQQVIYLDPMFPERKKSAAVKRSMVLLHEIVGADDDSDRLFQAALKANVCRVVVKRPKLAAPLGNAKPSLIVRGSSSRFDIYPNRAIV